MKPEKGIAHSGSHDVARARSRVRDILKTFDAVVKPCVMVLIDCSASMAGEPLEQAKRGVIDFALTARDRGYLVGLVRFGSSATVVHDPGGTGEALGKSVESLEARGSTNMVDALERGMAAVPQRSHPRSLVVVTDGRPDDPDATMKAARTAVESGFEILAIGTESADHAFLARLVTRPGTDLRVSTRELSAGMKRMAGLLPSGPV